MKKLMMLAAMLAMAMVAAAPALAQPTLEIELDDLESGGASGSSTITSSGDNANTCAALLNAQQTGNLQNVQGVLQYASELDDVEVAGGSITLSPALEAACEQTVEQAAAAGSGGEAKAGGAQAKAGEAKAGGAEAKAGGGEAKAGGAEAKAGGGGGGGGGGAKAGQLPATGGASLLALGAGALLVGGGLIARRFIR